LVLSPQSDNAHAELHFLPIRIFLPICVLPSFTCECYLQVLELLHLLQCIATYLLERHNTLVSLLQIFIAAFVCKIATMISFKLLFCSVFHETLHDWRFSEAATLAYMVVIGFEVVVS